MRIWDIHPGYLNRQSLLGEHRELHGIVSILENHKKGYARHPETLRWVGYGWAIQKRHALLASEMALRGYKDKSPVVMNSNQSYWPEAFIDLPLIQYRLLKKKYIEKEKGRIPLPETAQEIWRQHKYSIMARDQKLYRELGREISCMSPGEDFSALSDLLLYTMRKTPSSGGIYNSIQHMWGHVSLHYSGNKSETQGWTAKKLLTETQGLALLHHESYLISSTALSELEVWL